MKIHESKCVFSKDRKSCYTCKFSYESGLGGEHIPGCELKMDIYEGYKGDCAGWVWEKLEEDRDNKLKDLGL
jgi:hypothetical protein